MLITHAYAGFAILAILAFVLFDPRRAAVALYFGGWLLLPVGHYPPGTMTTSYFTVNVIGAGLPANLGLTKAAVIPPVILLVWLLVRVRRIVAPALAPLDYAIAAFCAWPLAGALIRGSDLLAAAEDVAYLGACWGGTWALARLLLRDQDGRIAVLRGAAWSAVALLPVAAVEGFRKPWLYEAIWGNHPFLLEGAARTVGYRPLGFFEHGNQYALWLAAGCLAWLALLGLDRLGRGGAVFTAATAVATVASQSIGAMLLLAAGAAALWTSRLWLMRSVLAGGVATMLVGAVYLSGVVPVERLRHSAALAPQNVARFSAVRLKSLLYRVRRDQMAIPILRRAPVAGMGHWDWWRPIGSHPWGLPLLLAGQFGAVAVLLLLVGLLVPAVSALFRGDRAQVACAILVLMAAADALLNSFIYFPAVLLASALVSVGRPMRQMPA